jgi:hypothetical protein
MRKKTEKSATKWVQKTISTNTLPPCTSHPQPRTMTSQEPCQIDDLCESVGLAGLAFEMELEEHAPHCSILFCRTPSGPCHDDVSYSEPRGSDDAMHEASVLCSPASPDTTCPSWQTELRSWHQASSSDSDAEGDAEYSHARRWVEYISRHPQERKSRHARR